MKRFKLCKICILSILNSSFSEVFSHRITMKNRDTLVVWNCKNLDASKITVKFFSTLSKDRSLPFESTIWNLLYDFFPRILLDLERQSWTTKIHKVPTFRSVHSLEFNKENWRERIVQQVLRGDFNLRNCVENFFTFPEPFDFLQYSRIWK